MKYLIFTAGLVVSFYFLAGCKTQGPQPEDMVGVYTVDIQSDSLVVENADNLDKTESFEFDADSFAFNFEKSMENVGDQIADNLDTSGVDGKLEYSIQMFGKTMEQFGKGMENFAEDMGKLGEQIAVKSKKWKNQLLQNIHFEVDLQQDGDCKIKNLNLDFLAFRDARWEVKNDSLYVLKDKQTPLSFFIEKIEKDKIYLKKEDIILVLTRKK